MRKHTPGPWAVSGKPEYAGFKVVDGGKRSIAAFPSTSTRDNGERSANARLIAAAPDLLAALYDLTIAAEAAGFDIDGNADVLNAARAALYAANGGEA